MSASDGGAAVALVDPRQRSVRFDDSDGDHYARDPELGLQAF